MISDREKAISEAKEYIKEKPVFLDTETTGLDDNAEIIEICIINIDGEILLDTLVKPTKSIPLDSSRIHGITNQMVDSAPGWCEIWSRIQTILNGRTLGIYNAEYDTRLMKQTCKLNGIPWIEPYSKAFCIMELYSKYHGDWNDYHQSYTWQKLEVARERLNIQIPNDHSAKNDTLLSRAVLFSLAGG